jgi:chemotaxis protein MotA
MNILFGSIVVIGSILGGYVIEDGHIAALYQPAELLIIGGAAVGAFFISNPKRTLQECLHGVMRSLRGTLYTRSYYAEALALMYAILMKIRKEGMMGIEADIEDPYISPLFERYPACWPTSARPSSSATIFSSWSAAT